jgi:hypothetical protein
VNHRLDHVLNVIALLYILVAGGDSEHTFSARSSEFTLLPPRNNWRLSVWFWQLQDLVALGHCRGAILHSPFRKRHTHKPQTTRTQLTAPSNHGAEAVGLLPPAAGRFNSGSHYC